MINHRPLFAIGTIIVAAAVVACTAGLAPAERQGVLAALRLGQAVQVKDSGGSYEIGVLEKFDGTLGYKVMEIGADYVVCRDIADVTELRIPVYSVKSVTVTRIGR
jgi:hypothetical protein